jgi:twitching motility protein PilT
VLISTAYIRDCVADPEKTSLIADAIVSGGSQYGMQSFDQAILKLYQDGLVTLEEALRSVTNVEEFKMRLRGITSGSTTTATIAGAPEPSRIQRFGA